MLRPCSRRSRSLAQPIRRSILDRLRDREHLVGELVRSPRAQPAAHVQAPSGAARCRVRDRPRRRPPSLVRTPGRAPRRARRVADAVPLAVGVPPRPPRHPPGLDARRRRHPMTDDLSLHRRRPPDGARRAALPPPDREGVAGGDLPRTPSEPGFPIRCRARASSRRRDALPGVRRRRCGEAGIGRDRSSAPHLLAFTWGTDRLTFELAPDGDGTRFVLTHCLRRPGRRGQLRDRLGVVPGGPAQRARRRTRAGSGPRGRPGTRSWSTSSGSTGRRSPSSADGWTVRYERQLTCPAEVAWDLWFGHRPGHRRAAPGPGRRRAADAVHGAGPRDRHDDRRRRAAAAGLRRGARPAGPATTCASSSTPGTGHGARLVLTVSGTDPAELDAAMEQWGGGAVGHLASEAARWALANSAA